MKLLLSNEGASNLTLVRPDALSLLIQTRRAPGKVQVEVMKWLIRKFPGPAKEFLENQV
ncbi:hypothetical protein [Larkinella punicea]|uniref:hypothetical protein n=1 Tax=Larkinella punicea TaxID=2315727 RepID=UPI001CA44E19|nr:hypothetical protein [Larkinella punicea]